MALSFCTSYFSGVCCLVSRVRDYEFFLPLKTFFDVKISFFHVTNRWESPKKTQQELLFFGTPPQWQLYYYPRRIKEELWALFEFWQGKNLKGRRENWRGRVLGKIQNSSVTSPLPSFSFLRVKCERDEKITSSIMWEVIY